MKMVVRGFALLLFVATIGLWAGLSGSFGWTKTKIPHDRIDPVTGINYVEWTPGFSPGVEFLALGVGGSVLIFAATLFVRITPKNDA
jgi:hypothetical protein